MVLYKEGKKEGNLLFRGFFWFYSVLMVILKIIIIKVKVRIFFGKRIKGSLERERISF